MDQTNNNPKQALIERLKQSKNILVTVSNNPSVDQLAACLGLTIWLNRAEKHATAVFSGEVPSTLEFLQPAETLEKNTDSLRDFIISLDKSKADKLRYKVEENVVKIFITPYRTSLSADDLEYSQGDFNVDTVIALGVSNQGDLDAAITSHGRILHDATVVTITTGDGPSDLGSIQWHDPSASSLSELVVDLGNSLDQPKLDNQIATALLTGIVAQTERFSNDKTTPRTMSVSAELMSAGANQQLVVSKLEEQSALEPVPVDETQPENDDQPPTSEDGSLEIDHEHEAANNTEGDTFSLPEPDVEPEVDSAPEAETQSDSEPEPEPELEKEPEAVATAPEEPHITDVKRNGAAEEPLPYGAHDAPQLVGGLDAAVGPAGDSAEPVADPLSQTNHAESTNDTPLLEHKNATDAAEVADQLQPAPADWMPPAEPAEDEFMPAPSDTLAQIEQAVESPHIAEAAAVQEAERPDLDEARDEVMKAIQDAPAPAPPEPVAALNAQPIDLNPPVIPELTPAPPVEPLPVEPQVSPNGELNLPPAPVESTSFNPDNFAIANDPEPNMPSPSIDPNQPATPELTGPVEQPYTMPLPPTITTPPVNPVPPTSFTNDPAAPPPVPPPLPFNQPR